MKSEKENKSFGMSAMAIFIFAICGIFFSVCPAQTVKTDSGNVIAAPREVRVVTQTAMRGQTVTVVIETDAMGDESVYNFSLNYTPSILTYVPSSAMIGSGATTQSGGMCDILPNPNNPGQIGFSIDCGSSTITAGNNRPLVTMQFMVASNAPTGSTPLKFGDVPAARSVSSSATAGAMNLPTTFTDGTVNIAVAGSNRAVRVVSQNTTRGSTVTLVLSADAVGDESSYGFSLNYKTDVLTYVPNSAMIGSGATKQSGGMCDILPNPNNPGQIGFSVDCGSSTITAGNNRPLVTMKFTVASNAPTGSTPLTFGDVPAARTVSNSAGSGQTVELPTSFFDGFVNVALAPTAATAQVSGKISASGRVVRDATVYLINSNGVPRTTQTNAFGYYRFNGIEVGKTYTVTVRSKRYQFAPRVISILGTVENLDFQSSR